MYVKPLATWCSQTNCKYYMTCKVNVELPNKTFMHGLLTSPLRGDLPVYFTGAQPVLGGPVILGEGGITVFEKSLFIMVDKLHSSQQCSTVQCLLSVPYSISYGLSCIFGAND